MNQSSDIEKLEAKKHRQLLALLALLLLKYKTAALMTLGIAGVNRRLLLFVASSRRQGAQLAKKHVPTSLPDHLTAKRHADLVAAIQVMTARVLRDLGKGMTAGQVLEETAPIAKEIVTHETLEAYSSSIIRGLPDSAQVQWDATLDKRTCSICEHRHGTVYTAKEAPACPEHFRCRCFLMPI